MSVDPLAEKYPGFSSYIYCANNPNNIIDVDGQSWEPYDEKGNTIKIDDQDNIKGYHWVDYATDNKGNKKARKNTVETAYVFGGKGMTTLSSEGYMPHKKWESYGQLSTGNTRVDENISSLDPRIRNRLKAIVLELRLRYGIDIRGAVQGGFRTYSEQDKLYEKGASKAKGGYSNHNFGIALDVAIYGNGKYLPKGTEWQYEKYGNVAKKRGFMRGGDWKSFFDPAHIEYKHNKTLKQLRAWPKDKNGFLK